MFTDGELKDLKKEQILMERADRKYYRSKLVHYGIYGKLTEVMKPYRTYEALKMLNHAFKAKNGGMNMSVAS